MSGGANTIQPEGIRAIDDEMARQMEDALATFGASVAMGQRIAGRIRANGRLLMLGMGASHAVGRMVEPLYRGLGIEAIALPLSEQIYQPLPGRNRVVLLASQSGESAEIIRWLDESDDELEDVFGLTLSPQSSLARRVPSMIGAGGPETAFAATRSLTVTLAMHMAVLFALGETVEPALARLRAPEKPGISAAVEHFAKVDAIVISGRFFQGVAEALALGLTELSRLPCFALEGGQLRHGPMEMLGPRVGVVLVRGDEPTADLTAGLVDAAANAGSPVLLIDASGRGLPANRRVATLATNRASGLEALFCLLPVAQSFMVGLATSRVENAGTPVRSSKITRSE